MNNRAFITILLLVVLVYYIFNILPSGGGQVTNLNYSEFLTEVNRGNVARVTFQGERIFGEDKQSRQFTTIATHDPTVVEKLKAIGAEVSFQPNEGTPWYISLLITWGPMFILMAIWIFFIRRMPGGGGGGGKIMNFGKSQAKLYEETKDITFESVAGVEEAKEDLVEIVDFLKDPGKFWKIGGKIPKGVLMIGPPGTGKTLLAKAVAGEAGVPFFSISGSDFVEMFVGVGASRVRDLFREAFEHRPCIIFIDEIDAVGRHRGAGLGSGHDEREQTLNALLVEMDGFDGTEGIITIAATNRVDILDPALTRPGRFDRQVTVGLPDIKGRLAILKVHSKKIALKEGTDLTSIAKRTPGFSGAELANLINESALHAAKQNKRQVELEDLEWARDKVMMGAERRSLIMTPEEKRETAYHEAGHALVAAFTEHSDPVHKITIIPRGQALGLTAYMPEDRLSLEKQVLIARIRIAMGGMAAEEISMNNTTSGVTGDLQSATNLAYRMISQWGMSSRLGARSVAMGDSGNYLAMDYNQQEPPSEEIQEIVDDEVKTILADNYRMAKELLLKHRDKLNLIAERLLEIETIEAEEFYRLIGLPQPKDSSPEEILLDKADTEQVSSDITP